LDNDKSLTRFFQEAANKLSKRSGTGPAIGSIAPKKEAVEIVNEADYESLSQQDKVKHTVGLTISSMIQHSTEAK